MKNNCWICGKEYDACLNCNKTNGWKRFACSEEHYQIHQILSEYREGIINPKEATEMFEHLDIKADTELNLLEAITTDIKAIIAKGTPKSVPKPKSKSVDKDVDDE